MFPRQRKSSRDHERHARQLIGLSLFFLYHSANTILQKAFHHLTVLVFLEIANHTSRHLIADIFHFRQLFERGIHQHPQVFKMPCQITGSRFPDIPNSKRINKFRQIPLLRFLDPGNQIIHRFFLQTIHA